MRLTILLARPIRAILSAKIMSAQEEGTCRMNEKRFCGDAEGCGKSSVFQLIYKPGE